jgi:hypothetical protein
MHHRHVGARRRAVIREGELDRQLCEVNDVVFPPGLAEYFSVLASGLIRWDRLAIAEQAAADDARVPNAEPGESEKRNGQ